MKTFLRPTALAAMLALSAALSLAVAAQEPKTPPAAPEPAVAPTAPSTSSDGAKPAETATVPPAAAPAAAASTATTAPAEPATADKPSELRRLDKADTTTPDQPAPGKRSKRTVRIQSGGGNDRVAIGHDVELAENENADDLVAVMGSATNAGRVNGSVVSVLGSTTSTGTVGDSAVAVLGNTSINGRVSDAVVAVLGDVDLGPNAEVGGDVVSVGGAVHRDPKAIIHGHVQNVAIGGGFGHVQWAQSWFTTCLLKLRLLAFAPNLGWAWSIALGFLVFYALLALLFRPGMEKCVTTLETRPGYSVLAAVLTVILIPVTIVLLCITVVGIAVVPFVAIGAFCATLFGKAAMLAWIGRRFTRFFGDGPLNHPAIAVLIGGVIMMLIYTIPVAGMVFYKLLGWLGLGLAVYTLMLALKRDKPPTPTTTVPVTPYAPPPVGGAAGAASFAAFEPALATAGGPGTVPPVAPPVAAIALPHAGFWIRIWALFIDCILVAVIMAFTTSFLNRLPGLHLHFGPGEILPALALYGALMWKLRGTTIGGIVAGLKLVRLDQREIDWATAIVRALACFLSLIVAGLGFIWIAIDDEKQSWHDKIAGTAVVRMPRGTPLV